MPQPAASSGTSAQPAVGIIGTGLIGTSIIAQLLSSNTSDSIHAFDTNTTHTAQINQQFKQVKLVEDINGLSKCDIVFVCTPVSFIADYVAKLAKILGPDAIIIDTGSTKADIIADVSAALPTYTGFVPGHPMAGSHFTGPETADENVLHGKAFVLTPYALTSAKALQTATAVLGSAGFKTIVADATTHDEILALTSHLPHLIAFAMVAQFAKYDLSADMAELVAGSYQRMTIHAKSDAKMWSDIFASNRKLMREAITGFRHQLDSFEKLITEQDDAAVMDLIKNGQRHLKEPD